MLSGDSQWSQKYWCVKGFISCFWQDLLPFFLKRSLTNLVFQRLYHQEKETIFICFLYCFLVVAAQTPSYISGLLVICVSILNSFQNKIKMLRLHMQFTRNFQIVSCGICRQFDLWNVSKYEENFRKPYQTTDFELLVCLLYFWFSEMRVHLCKSKTFLLLVFTLNPPVFISPSPPLGDCSYLMTLLSGKLPSHNFAFCCCKT